MANIVKDTFTDTNGVLLSNHTSDTGQRWTVNSVILQNPQIQTNQLTLSVVTDLAQANAFITAPKVPSAAQVSCLRSGITNGYQALYFRAVPDLSSYLAAIFGVDVDSGNTGVFYIEYNDPTSGVVRTAQTSVAWVTGAMGTARLAVLGSNVLGWWNASNVVTMTPPTLLTSLATCGLFISSAPKCPTPLMDTFTVEAVMSVASSTFQEPAFLTALTLSSGITFVAKDSSGATLTGGGDVFTATIGGTNAGSSTSILDNGDGTYGIYYTPPKRGHDVPSAATSNTTTSGDTIPVNPPLPSQQTNPPSSWTYPPGPGTDQGGGAFEQGGGGKFYGGFNGGPSFSDRYSKLAPINDGAGDVNFVYRVDDIAPIIVADTQPVNVIDFPGALEP